MEQATAHAAHDPNLNRLAVSATTHCLTGCAIGELGVGTDQVGSLGEPSDRGFVAES